MVFTRQKYIVTNERVNMRGYLTYRVDWRIRRLTMDWQSCRMMLNTDVNTLCGNENLCKSKTTKIRGI